MPKKTIATGIHAIGLIGRRICSSGLTTWFAAGNQPRHKPSGIADQCRGRVADRNPPKRVSDIGPQHMLLH